MALLLFVYPEAHPEYGANAFTLHVKPFPQGTKRGEAMAVENASALASVLRQLNSDQDLVDNWVSSAARRSFAPVEISRAQWNGLLMWVEGLRP